MSVTNTVKRAPIKRLLAACALATPFAANAEVFISEIHYDNASSDVGEAIELTGDAGTDLTGWSIVLYNGTNSQRSPYRTTNLSGLLNAPEGCSSGVYVENYPSNGIQNGAPDGIALVDNNGTVIEFISYEGSFVAASGPAEGMTSINIGVSETSSTPVGHSLQRIDGTWNAPSESTFGVCPGGDNGGGEPEVVKIHEIQGNGATVAMNEVVTVEAIVVADYQASSQLRGFFIQEEDADIDTDSATSEGIFVYCSNCTTDVSVGDQVRVTGLANEFFEMSQINATQDDDIEVLTSGNALPTSAILSLPVATSATDVDSATAEINAYYEQFEGMLVTIPNTLSVTEYFQLGRFGQVVLSEGGRFRQFTDSATPSAEGYAAHQIDVASRRIILDDENNSQNFALFNDAPVFHPQPGFSVDNTFRGGDTITGLTGALHWSWAGSGSNAWRIRPVSEAYSYAFTSNNERSENPYASNPDLAEAPLKVASFNVLNYFTTLDEGSNACGPNGTMGCRGANSPEELERQTQKIVAAMCALNADIVGLMEIENPQLSATTSPIATLVEAINAQCAGYAAIDNGTTGTDAITVGLIYKPEAVEAVGKTAVLDSTEFVDPNETGVPKNRAVLAQSFKDIASGQVITVAVNHLKSKGSDCSDSIDPNDDDTTMGQGNCNGTRTKGAEVQAAWLATNPTGVDASYSMIIGDLNAYRNEAPITALKSFGYVDLIDLFNGEDAYSYVFDGQLGYLDYAMANEALLPFVKGVAEWHINADEVNLLDYNDTVRDSGEASFEAKPSALPLFNADAYRSSDHDPMVVGIAFPTAPMCDGLTATVYVNKDGIVVGGLLDGQTYTGKLVGTAGNDVIVGTEGSDRIRGKAGDDVICAGAGDDRVRGGRGADTIYGEAGYDVIHGGRQADKLYGGDQDDYINGKAGNDYIDGGAGWNFADGHKGKDTCINAVALRCEM